MKRVNAPPIPEGIRIKLSGEKEWEDVMQVFEDQGWMWGNGDNPNDNVKKYAEDNLSIVITKNNKILLRGYKYQSHVLTATEFLQQYQGTIEYEPGDWVVFIDTGCFTTVNQKIGDIVKILENNSQKERWSYKTTEGTIASVYPINTRIRPATQEEIASVTKESDVYIWDADVLPDEYWVENPTSPKGTDEWKKLMKKCCSISLSGGSKWYKINKDQCIKASSDTPPDNEPVVPYELWKSILEQPDPQAEPVKEKMFKKGDRIKVVKGIYEGCLGVISDVGKGSLYWADLDSGDKYVVLFSGEGGTGVDIVHYTEEQAAPKWSIVTTDGVTVYEGGDIWWIKPDGKTYSFSCTEGKSTKLRKVNEEDIRRGYKPFSTFEAAEKYRQEQLEPPSTVKEMWKVGDILPSEWLDSGIEDYRSYKGKSRGTSKKYYIGHRCVEQVREGWALISDTADIWLAPKDQYPTYPKAGSPDIVAKDGSIHDVKTVEPMIERTWKIGDKFTNGEGAIITITGPDEVDTHVLATWVKRDGSIIHGKPAKTGIDKWLQRKEWVPYNPEPIPVTKENAYIGMKVVRGKDWKWRDQDGGKGNVGEIVGGITKEKDWVSVQWKPGKIYSYRAGDSNKYDLYVAQEEVSVNQSINQTTNKKTENNGNNNQQPQKDSYSSNNQSSSITNFRVYPKVTSGQGYSTGKSSPAVYKVKPTVIEGYHREYSRK